MQRNKNKNNSKDILLGWSNWKIPFKSIFNTNSLHVSSSSSNISNKNDQWECQTWNFTSLTP